MSNSNPQSIVLGGGCFWCLDAVYRRVEGVKSSHVGFAGGSTADPDYRSIAQKATMQK